MEFEDLSVEVAGNWNCRVVKKMVGMSQEFGIYSVYYDDEGQPEGVSMAPEPAVGDRIDDLGGTLDLMKEALLKPLLNWEDIGGSE